MLTQEDDVDAHAFRKRGWSISAIARHLDHDRRTIRAYLNDERTAGVRAPAGEEVGREPPDERVWSLDRADILRIAQVFSPVKTTARRSRANAIEWTSEANHFGTCSLV